MLQQQSQLQQHTRQHPVLEEERIPAEVIESHRAAAEAAARRHMEQLETRGLGAWGGGVEADDRSESPPPDGALRVRPPAQQPRDESRTRLVSGSETPSAATLSAPPSPYCAAAVPPPRRPPPPAPAAAVPEAAEAGGAELASLLHSAEALQESLAESAAALRTDLAWLRDTVRSSSPSLPPPPPPLRPPSLPPRNGVAEPVWRELSAASSSRRSSATSTTTIPLWALKSPSESTVGAVAAADPPPAPPSTPAAVLQMQVYSGASDASGSTSAPGFGPPPGFEPPRVPAPTESDAVSAATTAPDPLPADPWADLRHL